jgi:tungstate transport system substrate-binding protein
MARVRGLKDIRKALRWIASARGAYMSSSPALGTRELELTLWQSIGVNVQTRSTWYLEGRGDEASVLRQAGSMGAYVLVERMTWAAQENRRGLEVLVEGDPALRTDYVSYLVRETSQDARAWFEWLSSETARTVIASFSLNGMKVLTPAIGSDAEGPPSRT